MQSSRYRDFSWTNRQMGGCVDVFDGEPKSTGALGSQLRRNVDRLPLEEIEKSVGH
ncbi:hypothetical protein [Frigoribacterium sp. ACAM 257]|uniref:hypothetical protein n=1 Tax=Frigoribacterium sp. ACAM 257 TaxID=2508998 RepID=UPI001CB9B3B6|nr:hypothetical protein [Frigoribacterium sp. ACAM 257]